MKKIGELLSAFFDEDTLKTAQGYSDLFSSWRDIAGENIAAHSRIMELERSVLQIEADHPGWIQILQTRQKSLLDRACRKFPGLTITGISFRLSRDPAAPTQPDHTTEVRQEAEDRLEPPEPAAPANPQDMYAKITNDEMRESLKRLEKDLSKNR
jgi:hypothetical protein